MQNRLTGVRRLTIEEKEQIRAKKLVYKDAYELKLKGSYERIFPLTEEQIKEEPHLAELQT